LVENLTGRNSVRKSFVVLGLIVSFFTSLRGEAAPPFKTYEYATQLAFSEGRVDLRIEMRVNIGSEDFADECVIWIKNSRSTEWTQIHETQLIRFSKIAFTRDLDPELAARDWITSTSLGENPRVSKADLGIHYLDSGLKPSQLNYTTLRGEIENDYSAIVKGATAIPEVTKTGLKPKPQSELVIQEGGFEFKLQFEGRDALLVRSDGKQVRFPREAIHNTPLFHIENGLLYIEGTARIFDLRMFDAEVSFIGDTQLPNTVDDADGYPIDPEEKYNQLYPDLVRKERELLARNPGKAIAEETNETVTRTARALRLNKSVKLLGPAGSGKTSEMQALARLIASGKIPSIPRTAQIRVISLNNLASGTKYVGELEHKMAVLLEYAKAAKPILLVDEFHVAVGVGVSKGNPNNIAQTLKPALEGGEIRMIGISTNQEWDHAFANDAAFDQRFEEVTHAAPTGADLRQKIRNSFTLRGLAVPEDEAIERAISLSDRFAITGAQPRKAVNLLIKASGIMDEFGKENQAATRAAVEKAAVETYHIDPATFDRAKIHERLSSMQSTLQSQIVGQRQAIEKINQVWFRKLSGVGSDQTANAILFYGPPGTGKTLTAKLSAQAGGYKSTVIEMNKYANGDIEAFRYEIFRALRESPNTVLILDEFEKAHPRVQNATLAMMQPGQFTVNFEDHNGRRVFEEVTSKNAIFVLTTNAGQSLFSTHSIRMPIGFEPAIPSGTAPQGPTPSQAHVTATLVQDGISEPVLSRVEAVVGLPRPTSDEFKIALGREIDSTLARESKKTGVKFRLTGKSQLVDQLLLSYQGNSSDYRDVGYLVRENLDPLIAQAIIEPDFEKARVIEIKWSPDIDPKSLPSRITCDFLARKINRPLSSLGKK
jgi:ATP-dependent Clp protease ATP-binding subunit ClpA